MIKTSNEVVNTGVYSPSLCFSVTKSCQLSQEGPQAGMLWLHTSWLCETPIHLGSVSFCFFFLLFLFLIMVKRFKHDSQHQVSPLFKEFFSVCTYIIVSPSENTPQSTTREDHYRFQQPASKPNCCLQAEHRLLYLVLQISRGTETTQETSTAFYITTHVHPLQQHALHNACSRKWLTKKYQFTCKVSQATCGYF